MHFSFYLIYFFRKIWKTYFKYQKTKTKRERERERESDLTYIKYCESYYIKVWKSGVTLS